MHGKHSKVMFIPLYRKLVCNSGIDSRKCATGCGLPAEDFEMCFESEGWETSPFQSYGDENHQALPMATDGG